jgi:hypothetical protein
MRQWRDGADVRVHLSSGTAVVGYDLFELNEDAAEVVLVLHIEGTGGNAFTEALIALDDIIAIEQLPDGERASQS